MHLSKAIFDLIDDVCAWDIEKFRKLDEPTFIEFRQNYILLAELREKELRRFLRTFPTYFRSFLPITNFSFQAAKELVWYQDEMVIADPFLVTFNTYENAKAQMALGADCVWVLNEYRMSIETGYILLTSAGTNKIESESPIVSLSSDLVTNSIIENGFLEYVLIAEKPSLLPDGRDVGMKQLMSQYNSLRETASPMSTYIPQEVFGSGQLSNGIMYDFMTPMKRINIERLRELGKVDLLDGLKRLFQQDCSIILSAAEASNSIQLPLLTVRDVDFKVAQFMYGKDLKLDELQTLKYMLPYVDGVSSQRLHEIRQEIPMAFKEFRSFILGLQQEAKSKGYSNAETQAHIEGAVAPELRRIEVEMGNATKKAKYKWVDTVVSILSGSFVINGNVTQPLSDLETEKRNATLNPTYFLWKARTNRGNQ